MEFKFFKLAIQNQFDTMSSSELFLTDVTKDTLWETYLTSFPEGTNPIFRERREHDCQCCKQFIRACGNVVAIIDGKLVSIWDIHLETVDNNGYQVVADAMAKMSKSAMIKDLFRHYENNLGTDYNDQYLENETSIRWNHFYFKLPNKFVKNKDSIGTFLSETRSNLDVFKRGLEEITMDSIETVLELIDQNSLYRGEEHKPSILAFMPHKKEFMKPFLSAQADLYAWANASKSGTRIRNTVIGTLLLNISSGMELDEAVGKFEAIVAPTNYKRPTALITKSMIENARKKFFKLGFEGSENRRYAIESDLTINNVSFANREAKKQMDAFDELAKAATVNPKSLDKVEEVPIDTFMKSILPKAENIEVMFENKHTNNLMSLIAPQDTYSKHLFKWNNNFSWAYNGEVADSIKERVKRAGGNVSGVLRFSIQWNDCDNNQNDFDAHCVEPNGNLIHYPIKGQVQPSSGMLDVDIINPGRSVAVENITWTNIDRMQEGEYVFLVHNYSHCGGKTGFTAEIEYNGMSYSYSYPNELRQGERVRVARIEFSRSGGIKFIESLPSTQASKEVWGISTNQFHKVSMIMNSPNHWDGNETGNKHHFFILEDCKNPDTARGFFNEFLQESLTEHRKVFEALGSKMKVEKSDNQLSGLGFSSTQKNSVLCKVTGSFTRTIKIIF